MKIQNDTFYFDRPIWKNKILGTLLFFCALSTFYYFIDNDFNSLIVGLFLAAPLVLLITLMLIQERFCKFTDDYIEYRSNFFKPVIKIVPGYLKNIQVSTNAITFNRINNQQQTLTFRSKNNKFFIENIYKMVQQYKIPVAKKILLRDKNVTISDFLQSFVPLLMLTIISIYTKEKSLTGPKSLLFIAFLIAAIIFYFIRKKYQSYIILGERTIVVKNNRFGQDTIINTADIKAINKNKNKFTIITYRDQNFPVKATSESHKEVENHLKKIIANTNIKSNFYENTTTQPA